VTAMRAIWTALLAAALLGQGAAQAAEAPTAIQRSWPHQGIFGTFDRPALQRGLQVYEQVCAGCHGLRFIAFRNLLQLGFSEDEVRAIAANHFVTDGPDDQGEMFERPAVLSDRYPDPYPNDQAARLANNGALPPDLSLMTKARADGVNYVYSLLVGYEDPPPGFEVPDGMHYNAYFAGHLIAMPEILFEGSVDYADGTPATLSQMAQDLAQFLNWAAEPTLEQRKQTGLKVILFLLVFTGLFYALKRKVWARLHQRPT
jgi:ubiquinol-cytochrome c reductase cytochrome c1 subunit